MDKKMKNPTINCEIIVKTNTDGVVHRGVYIGIVKGHYAIWSEVGPMVFFREWKCPDGLVWHTVTNSGYRPEQPLISNASALAALQILLESVADNNDAVKQAANDLVRYITYHSPAKGGGV